MSGLPFRRFLHDRDLIVGEAVEFVHQPVDLVIGSVDLALQQLAVG